MRGMMNTQAAGASRPSDEDGAVAVIVAITIFVLFGMAALAIDAGMLWVNRRVTSSDADAATVAALVKLREGEPCNDTTVDTWADFAVETDNQGDNTQTVGTVSCWIDTSTGETIAAKVDVEHRTTTSFAFAQIFPGVGPTGDVYARSIGEYGSVGTMDGLRPISLCVNTLHYQEYKAGLHNTVLPDDVVHFATASGVAHRVDFGKLVVGEGDCNPKGLSGAGNFGWLDFDGNGAASDCAGDEKGSELDTRLENGYQCAVTADQNGYVSTPNEPNCRPGEADDDCPAETGAVASTKKVLEDVLLCDASIDASNCEQFWVLVYDSLDGSGGANLSYYPVGFAPVVLRDFNKVTGKIADLADDGKTKFLDPVSGKKGGSEGSSDCVSTKKNITPDAPWFCFEFLDVEDIPGTIDPNAVTNPIVKTFKTMHLCGVEADDLCALPTK